MNNIVGIYDDLYNEIRDTLLASRKQAYAAVNSAMVMLLADWAYYR